MPSVELRGNSDLRKALRQFAPDLEKQLKTELKAALMPIVTDARGFVPGSSPLSGWATHSTKTSKWPQFDSQEIKRGIVYRSTPTKRNKNGFTGMAGIYNKTAAGAIYETAGRVHPDGRPQSHEITLAKRYGGKKVTVRTSKDSQSNNSNAGKQFINAMGPITSSLQGRGRLIYRAWAKSQGRAEGAAMKAIDKATQEFYARSSMKQLGKAA